MEGNADAVVGENNERDEDEKRSVNEVDNDNN